MIRVIFLNFICVTSHCYWWLSAEHNFYHLRTTCLKCSHYPWLKRKERQLYGLDLKFTVVKVDYPKTTTRRRLKERRKKERKGRRKNGECVIYKLCLVQTTWCIGRSLKVSKEELMLEMLTRAHPMQSSI